MNRKKAIYIIIFAVLWLLFAIASTILFGALSFGVIGNKINATALIGLWVSNSGLIFVSGVGIIAYMTFRFRQLSATRMQIGNDHTKISHIAASVGRLRRDLTLVESRSAQIKKDVEAIDQRSRRIFEHTEREAQINRHRAAHIEDSTNGPRSLLVAATKREMTAVPGKTAGRNAAAFKGDNNVEENLAKLICPPESKTRARETTLSPVADGIVSSGLRKHVKNRGLDLQTLQPMISTVQRRPSAAFFIVEDEALITGVWAGALQTQGTSLYKELRKLLSEAKRDGSALVFVATRREISHFVQEIESMCDLVITDGEYDISWAPDARIPYIECISEYQLKQGA